MTLKSKSKYVLFYIHFVLSVRVSVWSSIELLTQNVNPMLLYVDLYGLALKQDLAFKQDLPYTMQ